MNAPYKHNGRELGYSHIHGPGRCLQYELVLPDNVVRQQVLANRYFTIRISLNCPAYLYAQLMMYILGRL